MLVLFATVLLAGTVLIALVTRVATTTGRTGSEASFGQIPPAAFTHHGIDWSLVPTYVSTISHGRLVGYVSKSYLEHPEVAGPGPRLGGSYEPGRHSSVMPVVDKSLRVVGHIYAGVGFVAGTEQPSRSVAVTTVVGAPSS
jgi:hypothetical protein